LLDPLPMDNDALRFWALQGHKATHMSPLVTILWSNGGQATHIGPLVHNVY
jgi:hypothetical protein